MAACISEFEGKGAAVVRNSGDANGLWAREDRHAVEHSHADCNFGHLRTNATEPQAIARMRLEPVHQVLDKRAPMTAAALLSFRATALCNGVDGLISPIHAGRVLRPWHLAWWDRRRSAARGDRRMAAFRVVRAVATDDFNRRVGGNLVQQIGQHAGIVDILMRHQRSAYLAGLRIHCQMRLAPGAALRPAVFVHFPFAFAVQLEAGAVDDQMLRLVTVLGGQEYRQRLCTATERGIVWHQQIGECEFAQAVREALKRPQRQVKDLLESERHLDHCVRVDARSPTLARYGLSSVRQDVLVDPHGYIASGDQLCVVFRPVPDAIDPLGSLASLAFVFVRLPGQKSRVRSSTKGEQWRWPAYCA